MNTNKDLRYWYGLFNKRHFGDKLPKDLDVKFGKLPKGLLGTTNCIKYIGKDKHKSSAQNIRIDLNIRQRSTIVILTLLHEMVHVENPSWIGHGRRFDRRMKELAAKGAFNGLW